MKFFSSFLETAFAITGIEPGTRPWISYVIEPWSREKSPWALSFFHSVWRSQHSHKTTGRTWYISWRSGETCEAKRSEAASVSAFVCPPLLLQKRGWQEQDGLTAADSRDVYWSNSLQFFFFFFFPRKRREQQLQQKEKQKQHLRLNDSKREVCHLLCRRRGTNSIKHVLL